MSTTVICEYIWLDGSNTLRSKTRTVYLDSSKSLYKTESYEDWDFDGSSTHQATAEESEIILRPCAVYDSPFQYGNYTQLFVLCSTYTQNGEPHPTNHRHRALELFNSNKGAEPWFGLEQEFFLMQHNHENPSQTSYKPLGWNNRSGTFIGHSEPAQQGQYYCSVGSNNAFGRNIVERAYYYCLDAGLSVSGMNAEVAPGQWEIQLGPCIGIDACDQLLIVRYILNCVAEINNIQVNYEPKPISGNWNGSGCHINFSSKFMREKGGLDVINQAIEKLSNKHEEHLNVYGTNNDKRLSGKHETSSFKTFTHGVGDRSASVRIPGHTQRNQKGYFEDRRPGSNIDPYLATSKLFETCCL